MALQNLETTFDQSDYTAPIVAQIKKDGFVVNGQTKYYSDTEIGGGICRMLSVHWTVECAETTTSAPSSVIDGWKKQKVDKDGVNIFIKQIANNHVAYSRDYTGNWQPNYNELLELASGHSRERLHMKSGPVSGSSADGLAEAVNSELGKSDTSPTAVMFSIYGKDKKGNGWGHALAAVRRGKNTWIFDPNFGVAKVANNALSTPMQQVWASYPNTGAYRVGPVTRTKLEKD